MASSDDFELVEPGLGEEVLVADDDQGGRGRRGDLPQIAKAVGLHERGSR